MSLRDFALALGLMCLWGFNFSVIKLGAEQINPVLLSALRFTFAIFPAIFFIKRPNVPIGYLVVYGISFGVGIWGMMTWAINMGLSAGMAGVLMQLSLVFSLLLGWLFLKEHIKSYQKAGAALALAGLAVSLTLHDGSVPHSALILVLIAALSWSVTSLAVKLSKTTQAFAFSVWGMVFAPVPLVLLAWITHGSEIFIQLPAQMNDSVWFSILFQAYPTTLLGYWVWNRLVLKYPLSVMSILTTLVPVFGMWGSAIFYDEVLSSTKIVVCALIVSGLIVSQGKWPSIRLKKPLVNNE